MSSRSGRSRPMCRTASTTRASLSTGTHPLDRHYIKQLTPGQKKSQRSKTSFRDVATRKAENNGISIRGIHASLASKKGAVCFQGRFSWFSLFFITSSRKAIILPPARLDNQESPFTTPSRTAMVITKALSARGRLVWASRADVGGQ